MSGKHSKGKLRPHVWRCGPDKFKHDMYMPWMRAKAQANFRGEGWDIPFENFYQIWKDYWHVRGTGGQDYCMTRLDNEKPWAVDNVRLVTRQEQMAARNSKRKGVKLGPRKHRNPGYGNYQVVKVKKKAQYD